MNSIELRYEIYKMLAGNLSAPAAVVQLASPTAGEDPFVKVCIPDPYRPGEARFYRVTVTEVDGEDA